MRRETELDLVDAIGAGPGQLARGQRQRGRIIGGGGRARSVVTSMVNSASAIASPDSSAVTSLASRLAALRRMPTEIDCGLG